VSAPPAGTPRPFDAELTAAKTVHQAGDFERARAGYEALLTRDPDHAETLYLAGALAYQQARYGEAEHLLRRCLNRQPGHAHAIETLAAALSARGRADEALVFWTQLAESHPASSKAWHDVALARLACGDPSGASAAWIRATSLEPVHAPALKAAAAQLRMQRRWRDADAMYRRAVKALPRDADVRDESAAVLFELGRHDEAEAMVRSALAIDPKAANAHTNLGRMLLRLPGRAAEALAHHDTCLAARPDYAEAHSNRAAALYHLGRIDEAEAACRRALALKPGLAEAHSNLGNVLQRRGDDGGAAASYRAAIAADPALADAHWNLGLALLATARFEDGWREIEWRWQCRDFPSPDRGMGLPRWPDTAPPDRPVLVWGEQGIGDEIVYGSMVPSLAAAGFPIVLECDNRLAPLWRRSCPALTVAGRGDHVATIVRERGAHHQIPIASLGARLRRRAGDFPAAPGFLKADPVRRDGFRALLGGGSRPIVGVSWASANDVLGGHKTAPLPAWREILTCPDAAFVSLQYGAAAGEATGIATVPDLDPFADLDGLAALIAACNLVITVSNVTAHLAGALGVPTWVLAPAGAGRFWYWQSAGESTPLYPATRIFRQHVAGDWSAPLAEAATELRRRAGP
jgi:tetratricopeptide (TPR) repeat protein